MFVCIQIFYIDTNFTLLTLFTLVFGQSQLFVYIQSKQKQTTYQTVNKDISQHKMRPHQYWMTIESLMWQSLGAQKLFLCLPRLSGFLKSERIFCWHCGNSLWVNRKKSCSKLVLYSLFPFKKCFSHMIKNILNDFSWAKLFD